VSQPEAPLTPPLEVSQVTDSQGRIWRRRYAPAWLWSCPEVPGANLRIEGVIERFGPITWDGMP
jgi:hypothetical protein